MIAGFLAARSARERGLLAALFVVAVPLGFVSTVALPMIQAREAARASLALAAQTRLWYGERQSEIAALPHAQSAVAPVSRAPIGLAAIESRLTDAGLRDLVVTLADAPEGGVSLVLAGAEFTLLIEWITGVEADAGYALSAMRLTATDKAGFVNADLRLGPAP